MAKVLKKTLRLRSGQAPRSKSRRTMTKLKKHAAKRKIMVKKVSKKVTKKLMKKTIAKQKAPVMAGTVGKVVHYYDRIGVAIVELAAPVMVGDLLTFRRGTVEFTQPVSSMQIDHHPVEKAGRGKVVGIKVVQMIDPGATVLRG